MPLFITWFLLILLIVLQTTFVHHLPFFTFIPELLLIFCVYIGARFDWKSGFWWGIVCGGFMSLFSLGDIKLYVFVFALSGMIAGSFRGVLFVDSISPKIILLFFISAGVAFIFAVFSKEARPSLFQLAFLQRYVIKIAFINCLFAIPLYSFFEKIYRKADLR